VSREDFSVGKRDGLDGAGRDSVGIEGLDASQRGHVVDVNQVAGGGVEEEGVSGERKGGDAGGQRDGGGKRRRQSDGGCGVEERE